MFSFAKLRFFLLKIHKIRINLLFNYFHCFFLGFVVDVFICLAKVVLPENSLDQINSLLPVFPPGLLVPIVDHWI